MRVCVGGGGGAMCDYCVNMIYMRHFPQLAMDVDAFASMHMCTSWVASMMDVADWQADAKEATYPSTSSLRMMDTTGGHVWRSPQSHTHTHTTPIHSAVFLNCSFSSSKDRADGTGHGLCTNYV